MTSSSQGALIEDATTRQWNFHVSGSVVPVVVVSNLKVYRPGIRMGRARREQAPRLHRESAFDGGE